MLGLARVRQRRARPGVRDRARATRAAHHLLLAHGRAVQAMRAQAPADHQFGIVLNLSATRPGPQTPPGSVLEVAATAQLMEGLQNRWWLDGLFGDGYPETVTDVLGTDLASAVRDGDLDEIGAPLDFLGVNYYFDQLLEPADRADGPADGEDGSAGTTDGEDGSNWRTGRLEDAYPGARGVRQADPGPDGTAMGWPVTPEGLTRILVSITEEYPDAPPLLVTENGSAYPDQEPLPKGNAVLDDPPRVAYLVQHLQALADAVDQGADVRGYFAWTLLDNFEWAQGYRPRFGLVRVDPGSPRRRPRRSFEVYRDVIAGKLGSPSDTT